MESKEQIVALVDLDRTEKDITQFTSDENFYYEALKLGTIYSIPDFQQKINDEEINLGNSYIRFYVKSFKIEPLK